MVKAILLQSRKAGPALIQEAVDKQVQALILGLMGQNETSLLGATIPYVLGNATCDVILWHNHRSAYRRESDISLDGQGSND